MRAVPTVMRRPASPVVQVLLVALVVGGWAGGLGGLSHGGSDRPGAPVSAAPPVEAAATHPVAGSDWAYAQITTTTFPSVVTPPVTFGYVLQWNSSYAPPYLQVTADFTVFAGPNQVELSSTALTLVQGPGELTLGYSALAGSAPMSEGPYNFTISIQLVSPLGKTTNASNTVGIDRMIVVNPSVEITSPVPVYGALPLTVNISVALDPANSGITAAPANVSVAIELLWPDGSCADYLPAPYSVCLQWVPAVVINASTAAGSFSYTPSGVYSFTFTTADLLTINYLNGQLPTGPYAIEASVTVTNSSNASFPGRTVETAAASYLAWNLPSATFLLPLNNTTGLVVGQPAIVVITYTGDYVTAAFFNVSNLSTGQLIYSQGIFQPGAGAHGSYAHWTPGSPGEVRLSVTLLTPYLAPSTTTEVERVAPTGPSGGGTTYVNTTYWHNATWIPGVSPAVGAALLLVAGLVVGMGVALLVAPGLGGFRSATSSRPPADRSASANVSDPHACPVCRQSFPGEDELRAHAQESHGIG